VHDELAAVTARWRQTLIADVEAAVEAGELAADTDPAQVAFSLEALAAGTNPARQLHGDTAAAAWSLEAMRAVLRLPPAVRA
jgi:hypothetical protein